MLQAPQDDDKNLAFYELAQRFRSAEDPADIEKLGDELGRRIFENEEVS